MNWLFPVEIHPVIGSQIVHPLWAPILPRVKRLHDRLATAVVFTQDRHPMEVGLF